MKVMKKVKTIFASITACSSWWIYLY